LTFDCMKYLMEMDSEPGSWSSTHPFVEMQALSPRVTMSYP